MDRKKATVKNDGGSSRSVLAEQKKAAHSASAPKNGGWREVEAMREKAALKASLADVWDEDFDLDDEILAELDHTAEFFTVQEDVEDEVFDEDDVDDVFFEED